MIAPACLQTHALGVCLAVKLVPRAARNEIGQVEGQVLKIKVTAPPVDGAANEALLRLLAERLDCPRHAVQLLRGHTGRHKCVLLRDLTVAAVATKLGLGS